VTGRERILAALGGELADRVPFVPNIWQWFHVNELRGTLPEALRGCRHPIEALRVLGADVLSKFEGSCNTSPLAPWENLLAFRDAAWRHGRLHD
jgi:hypothetical protein